jgi:pectinesterase
MMTRPVLFALAAAALCLLASRSHAGGDGKPDAVVAADGSGDHTSIQAAIMKAPYRAEGQPWVIRVKPGTYKERVYVQRERGYIRLAGEDPATTVLSAGLHAGLTGADGQKIGTFGTPTLQIDGDGFEIENLTVENTAGPVGQALALRADGDRLVFKNCRFLGWQDTLFLNRNRSYFQDCVIEGHVDFIFGGGAAWFENCRIHCRKGGYITAASTPSGQPCGFVFHRCRVTAEPGSKVLLGRAWRPCAMTAFIDCELPEAVRPEGWSAWNASDPSTLRYSERGSTGPGAASEARVRWATVAPADLTPVKALAGPDGWNPAARQSP